MWWFCGFHEKPQCWPREWPQWFHNMQKAITMISQVKQATANVPTSCKSNPNNLESCKSNCNETAKCKGDCDDSVIHERQLSWSCEWQELSQKFYKSCEQSQWLCNFHKQLWWNWSTISIMMFPQSMKMIVMTLQFAIVIARIVWVARVTVMVPQAVTATTMIPQVVKTTATILQAAKKWLQQFNDLQTGDCDDAVIYREAIVMVLQVTSWSQGTLPWAVQKQLWSSNVMSHT